LIRRLDVRALNLPWSRGSANPRQSSSSPVALVKTTVIASPISDGKLSELSGLGGIPPRRRYTPVITKTTTAGETNNKYSMLPYHRILWYKREYPERMIRHF
ncbi:MAG: hypothetical protein ACETVR_04125, partial [Candidatus Bathyarchaeia archaeon]